MPIQNLPDVCFIWIDEPTHNEARPEWTEELLQQFKLPRSVINGAFYRNTSNGYFGSKTFTDQLGMLNSCSTWFRCILKIVPKVRDTLETDKDIDYVPEGLSHAWYSMDFYTYWTTGGQCLVLCSETPSDFPQRLMQELNAEEASLQIGDPLVMHRLLFDRIIHLLDLSVRRVRDQARRSSTSTLNHGNFVELYEQRRHSIHLNENLEGAANVIEALRSYQVSIHGRLASTVDSNYLFQAKEVLESQKFAIQSLGGRAMSNDKRLENEINLAFNLVTRQDSKAMTTISIMTMVFLPATFVSAVLSTSFFDSGETGWTVSSKFWVFWAATIPLTVVVITVYVCLTIGRESWFKRKLQRLQ
ncbi:Notoamide biosynthesis cluster protein M' [Paramyrothecium foliicola]|nr:Notoamide biosynthesis cluster protein M' [Paramyrothecium foliicola]